MTEDRNRSARGDGQGAPLSVREREILGLIAGGDSGAQIAEALVLSPETVRTHIRNAMSKLGASSRAQAVALAFQRNEIGDQADTAADGRDRARGARIGVDDDRARQPDARQGRPGGREVRRDPDRPARGAGVPVRRRRGHGLPRRGRRALAAPRRDPGRRRRERRPSPSRAGLARTGNAWPRGARTPRATGSGLGLPQRRPRSVDHLRTDGLVGKARGRDLPDDAAEQAHGAKGAAAAPSIREPGRRDPGICKRRSAEQAEGSAGAFPRLLVGRGRA